MDEELFETLAEEYGEDVVRQYGEGLHDLGDLIYGDVNPLENTEDARGAHEEISIGSLRDQQYDSFEELVSDVEERLEQFEAAIRLHAAQEYLTSETEVPDELE